MNALIFSLFLQANPTTIVYENEHLLPGQLGQLLIVISLVASIAAAVTYFLSAKNENNAEGANWLRIARWSFGIHTFAIIGVFATLFYIIASHLFEYNYAWQHSSQGLEMKYLLSSFWEGSEGSFLLWIVWQSLLGLIVMARGKQWESRVMTIVAFVQAILGTMILGVHFGPDIKIGSTPFTLLRDAMTNAPIFKQANYLSFIKDGNGLNPTLQNYWMVIHPPVLFLGFSLCLIPFGYAIAALWKGDYKTWMRPCLQWSLIAGAVLGAGIMMGGAWAYESLSFGGYWAWDPVENASLVPWLLLIAGLHTLLIYKSTGRSLKITVVFLTLVYILIWYSTFLTRTGVLGDTSVHSFTGEGKALYWHLIMAIVALCAVTLIPMIKSWKKLPQVAGEEGLDSREFWMLIGSILILLGSVFISLTTSLPVWAPLYKAITGTDIAPPNNPVEFYNNTLIWLGVFLALLSGAILYLSYKKTSTAKFLRRTGIIVIVSIAITVGLVYWQNLNHIALKLFGFTIVFSLIANLVYIITVQKWKLKKAGAAVTHFGFAVMLLGILISGYNKQVISLDRTGALSGVDFNKETFEENLRESRENVLIFRNTTVAIGEYMVTYLGDSTVQNDPPRTYFKVRYDKYHPITGELVEQFYLYPDAFVNPKGQEGLNANPDSKHYWNRDVFTYITSFLPPSASSDSVTFRNYKVRKGDSVFLANTYIVFDGLEPKITNPNYKRQSQDQAAVEANINAYTIDGPIGKLKPVYVIQESVALQLPDTLRDVGTVIKINKILPDEDATELGIYQRSQQDDYIVMKAIVFPFINVLWLGIVVMIGGFFLSWYGRRK